MYYDDLLPALQRLDRLLSQAINAAEIAYGNDAATDPYRGLHVSLDEVKQLLDRQPGNPILWTPTSTESLLPLQGLTDEFNLSAFDTDIILIALAPELDRRYERLYAYLQDDVTRKRPTVDLALNLLCHDATTKLTQRQRFTADAPLIRHSLLHLIPDPSQVQPTLLAHYLKLDEQVVRLLLGCKGLDSRLVRVCDLVEPKVSLDSLLVLDEIKQALRWCVGEALAGAGINSSMRLYFYGPRDLRTAAAEAFAAEMGVELLEVNFDRAKDRKAEGESNDIVSLQLLFREARFQGAVLYLDGVEALGTEEDSPALHRLLSALAAHPGIAILAGERLWEPAATGKLGAIAFHFLIPEYPQRRAYWSGALTAAGIKLDPDDVDAQANRFRLTPEQINNSIVISCPGVSSIYIEGDRAPYHPPHVFMFLATNESGLNPE